MSSFTQSQSNAIQAIQTICSFVSFVSCLVMGFKIWSNKTKTMIDSLLAVLLFIDLVLAINFAVGIAGTTNRSYCQFQVLFKFI